MTKRLTEKELVNLERRANEALAQKYAEDAECLGEEVVVLIASLRKSRRETARLQRRIDALRAEPRSVASRTASSQRKWRQLCNAVDGVLNGAERDDEGLAEGLTRVFGEMRQRAENAEAKLASLRSLLPTREVLVDAAVAARRREALSAAAAERYEQAIRQLDTGTS